MVRSSHTCEAETEGSKFKNILRCIVNLSLSPKRNAELIAQRANCYILSGQDTGKIRGSFGLGDANDLRSHN